MLGFEGVEFGFVAEGKADVVEAVEEAVFAEGIDVEVACVALVVGDGLGFEVDGDLVGWIFGAAVGEEVDVFFGEADEDRCRFCRRSKEDVGEGGGDDGEEAEVGEGPGGVLAGAATAEVFAGDEDSAPAYWGWLRGKAGSGVPAAGPSWRRRQSKKRNSP